MSSQTDNTAQSYQFLRFGAVKPAGWLHAQLQRDLEHGFLGHLDALVPDLIVRDDIYGADRLTQAARHKDLGVASQETQWAVQYLWWNSETQSNWWDGLTRAALLLEQPAFTAKAQAHIEALLATQNADGYLGIYAPDLRYNFTGENGELWAQATALRLLLGYYEATGETRVLDAVQRAVACTVRAYPLGASEPFTVVGDFAGVGHGLLFTDVLDRLYQLTGDTTYLDYARWLYEEYDRRTLSQDDVQTAHLLDPAYRFQAHGVHTYEQVRSLATAVYASENPRLAAALAGYLARLETCLTPSGGPIGDEFIHGKAADASETGYEYCSLHELLDSYTHLLQKTGDLRWADRAEWLFCNAAQGARHPRDSAIAYLKTDNSFSMTGPLHPDDPVDAQNPQTRYKYSPAHQDAAVCCVPNAGRIGSYYVRAQWLRSADGLVAALYGACELHTEVNGVEVHIMETTHYPFDLEMTFTLNVDRPVAFDLAFRRPAWAAAFTLTGATACRESAGSIHVHQTWQSGDTLTLRFEAAPRVETFRDEVYFAHGPLLFALPLAGEAHVGREYQPGFHDLYYAPAADTGATLHYTGTPFTLECAAFEAEQPWGALALCGELYDAATHQRQPVRLLPLGATLLRRVTFGVRHNA